MDLSAFMDSAPRNHGRDGKAEHDMDGVYADGSSFERAVAMTMSIKENNLTAFKKYLDDENSEIHQYIGENGIVLVLDENNEISASRLYELGILPTDEYKELMKKIQEAVVCLKAYASYS